MCANEFNRSSTCTVLKEELLTENVEDSVDEVAAV